MSVEWTPGDGEKTIEEHAAESPTHFFCSWFCPYAQRAWICLEEKQVQYQYVEISPYKPDPSKPGGQSKNPLSIEEKRSKYPDFVSASPKGLVPAMANTRGDGKIDHVHDSLVVCEYIDDMFTASSSLLGSDPGVRARVRNCAVDMSQNVIPNFYKMLMADTTVAREDHKKAFVDGMKSFAAMMDAPGSTEAFFLGDTFSLADIAVLPWFERALSVGRQYRGMELPRNDDFSRLWQWYDSCLARPSFARTIVSQDRLIMNYSGYADGTATSDVAKTLVGTKRKPNL